MKIYEIQEGEKCYWTEGKEIYTDSDGNKKKGLGFWSKFELLGKDQRDFFIVKALLLFLLMKLNGNKVRLEYRSDTSFAGVDLA